MQSILHYSFTKWESINFRAQLRTLFILIHENESPNVALYSLAGVIGKFHATGALGEILPDFSKNLIRNFQIVSDSCTTSATNHPEDELLIATYCDCLQYTFFSHGVAVGQIKIDW